MLLDECRRHGVRVITDCDVTRVSSGFQVETSRGSFEAPHLVVATGGLSIPKMGATDLGYRIARDFGLAIVAPRAALVPLTFSDADRALWSDLSGVALTAKATTGGRSFREGMLFTHRGLSGPAILQASSYWRPGTAVEIDVLPELDLAAHLVARRERGDPATTRTAVAEHLPRRFVDRWFDVMAAPSIIAVTSNDAVAALAESLHHWRVTPSGTEGFEKAEVTAGGVDTRELSSQTMESRGVPGLYFIGEVVDVTGQLGGFNFQWAWASGFVAGQAV
jgi:predicted Rossmann fold flavoprotein